MRDFLEIEFTNDECRKMYQVFLNAQKGNVDLRKIVLGILVVLKIGANAKLNLAYKVYDVDNLGYITYFQFITIFSLISFNERSMGLLKRLDAILFQKGIKKKSLISKEQFL